MIIIFGKLLCNDDISRHFFFFFFFFQFLKILIFWFVKGRVKVQKTVQNNQKFCRSCFISQEPYIIWLSFMVHLLCKMIISPGVFFIFFKVWFFGLWVRGVKGHKMFQDDKNFCLLPLLSQEPYIIWLSFMVRLCKMIISPSSFFHFFQISIFRVVTLQF